jgi:hypothetical protein
MRMRTRTVVLVAFHPKVRYLMHDPTLSSKRGFLVACLMCLLVLLLTTQHHALQVSSVVLWRVAMPTRARACWRLPHRETSPWRSTCDANRWPLSLCLISTPAVAARRLARTRLQACHSAMALPSLWVVCRLRRCTSSRQPHHRRHSRSQHNSSLSSSRLGRSQWPTQCAMRSAPYFRPPSTSASRPSGPRHLPPEGPLRSRSHPRQYQFPVFPPMFPIPVTKVDCPLHYALFRVWLLTHMPYDYHHRRLGCAHGSVRSANSQAVDVPHLQPIVPVGPAHDAASAAAAAATAEGTPRLSSQWQERSMGSTWHAAGLLPSTAATGYGTPPPLKWHVYRDTYQPV